MSFLDYLVDKRFPTRQEGDEVIVETKGSTQLVSALAGFVVGRATSKSKANSTINVRTNILHFYAHNALEMKIQRELVQDLVKTGHYRLVYKKLNGNTHIWALRRVPR